jgi:phospholipid/cholesterol/gamma-HCH transport system ATP-binding protein
MTDNNTIISVKNLTKTFNGRAVQDHINLEVREGEVLAIIGGSGCGKSTLLRHLVGEYLPESGGVTVLGTDYTALKSEAGLDPVRKKIGILFQGGALYNSMTVGENVALPLREHSNLNEHVIKIIVKMKLELVGLRDFEDLMPSELSGGMRKRAALARAIALDPKILFYDEPSAGLDPVMTAVIDKLIVDLNKLMGITSIVVTHDMESAFRIAHRMVMLYGGRMVAEGPPEAFRNAADPRVRQFVHGEADGPIPLRVSQKDFFEDILHT